MWGYGPAEVADETQQRPGPGRWWHELVDQDAVEHDVDQVAAANTAGTELVHVIEGQVVDEPRQAEQRPNTRQPEAADADVVDAELVDEPAGWAAARAGRGRAVPDVAADV